MSRAIADIALLFSIILLPWWITVPLGVYFALRFKNYFELMVVGVALDALYGVPMPMFYSTALVFTVGCTVIFLFLQYLKPYLRFIRDAN